VEKFPTPQAEENLIGSSDKCMSFSIGNSVSKKEGKGLGA
jgi:hypothetical protein